jgi:hypothetical protein
MPVPEGNITTSDILVPVAQVEAALDAALAAADAEEEVIPFERIETDEDWEQA